jgi:hypothetical protein
MPERKKEKKKREERERREKRENNVSFLTTASKQKHSRNKKEKKEQKRRKHPSWSSVVSRWTNHTERVSVLLCHDSVDSTASGARCKHGGFVRLLRHNRVHVELCRSLVFQSR